MQYRYTGTGTPPFVRGVKAIGGGIFEADGVIMPTEFEPVEEKKTKKKKSEITTEEHDNG